MTANAAPMSRFRLACFSLALLGFTLPMTRADDEPPPKENEKKETAKRPFDLMVGDRAPDWHADEWLHGEAVTREKDTVYVLHFWATWNPPTILEFPKLTELQDKYAGKGLVIIGVTQQDERGSRLFAVKETLEEKKAEIGYSMAWDREGVTYDRFLTAAGYSKLSHVALIDRSGRIAYMGHSAPLAEKLELVMEGKFDTDKAAKEYAEELALREKKLAIEERLSVAYRERKFGEVILAFDELIALGPRFRNYAVNKFHLMMREMEDPEGAYAWARAAAETCLADDWYALNTLAYSIVIMNGIEPRDYEVAHELADRAKTVSKGENGQVWNTIGAIEHARGNLDKAIEAMEKAVELTDNANQKRSYARSLNNYRKQLENQK